MAYVGQGLAILRQSQDVPDSMTGILPSSARTGEIKLLGCRLHPMTSGEVITQIRIAVSERRRLIMANLNVHGMAMAYQNPAMHRLLEQDDTMVMIDGMPLLFLANMLHNAGLSRDKRTTSLDFYDEMFALGQELGWQFAYVGATEDVLQRGLTTLRERFPQLRIEGRNGYFDMKADEEDSPNRQILDWLSQLSPDIVITGMGMPRQEAWVEMAQHHVDARVFLTAGAYLDYQVGAQRPAPRWLGRYGLEWAYRLAHSPFRLGYRYLAEPFVLAYHIRRQRRLQRKNSRI